MLRFLWLAPEDEDVAMLTILAGVVFVGLAGALFWLAPRGSDPTVSIELGVALLPVGAVLLAVGAVWLVRLRREDG